MKDTGGEDFADTFRLSAAKIGRHVTTSHVTPIIIASHTMPNILAFYLGFQRSGFFTRDSKDQSGSCEPQT